MEQNFERQANYNDVNKIKLDTPEETSVECCCYRSKFHGELSFKLRMSVYLFLCESFLSLVLLKCIPSSDVPFWLISETTEPGCGIYLCKVYRLLTDTIQRSKPYLPMKRFSFLIILAGSGLMQHFMAHYVAFLACKTCTTKFLVFVFFHEGLVSKLTTQDVKKMKCNIIRKFSLSLVAIISQQKAKTKTSKSCYCLKYEHSLR